MFFPVIIILELLYECYKYYFISWDTNVSKIFDCIQINAVENCFFFAHLHNSNTDKRMWIWFVDDRRLLFSCLQMEKIKLFVILSFCVYLKSQWQWCSGQLWSLILAHTDHHQGFTKKRNRKRNGKREKKFKIIYIYSMYLYKTYTCIYLYNIYIG